VKFERAPRSKKRISCDLLIEGSRYKGIVLDVSATGLFVQTNVKPAPGVPVEVTLTLSNQSDPVVLDARVARKKAVPAALLTAAGGGVGLAIEKAPKTYLDFIAKVSPTQAAYVSTATDATRGSASIASAVRRSGRATSESAAVARPAGKRFRIHAVEAATGVKNSYLVACDSEEEASAQVLEQLGSEWQVIFVERV